MPETMTVATAEEIFRMGAGDNIRGVGHMLEDVRVDRHSPGLFMGTYKVPVQAPLPVQNPLFTLGYTQAILDRTRHSFNMVTGSDWLVGVLRDDFRQMLSRLDRNAGKARVIVLDGSAAVFQELQAEFGRRCLDVVTANVKSGASIPHYYVSDGKRVRDEKPHLPFDKQTAAALMARADMYFHSEPMGGLQDSRFGAQWQALTGDAIPKKRR